MTSAEQQFTEFATLASPRLRRTAFLLCGDWHTAEDLAQTTLAKVFVSWRRISRRDAAEAYATRTLVNTYLAGRRRKRARPSVLLRRCAAGAARPTGAAGAAAGGARRAGRAAAELTRVVVLRYWEDLSVEQVADLLGCSAGNVKSQSARALGKLRALLGDIGTEAGPREDAVRRGGTRQEVPGMDESTLRDLLARATATEPPIGALARNSVVAGIRLRRRRRAQGTAVCAAVVAVLCATVPMLDRLPGPAGPAGAGRRSHQPTVYVADQGNTGAPDPRPRDAHLTRHEPAGEAGQVRPPQGLPHGDRGDPGREDGLRGQRGGAGPPGHGERRSRPRRTGRAARSGSASTPSR